MNTLKNKINYFIKKDIEYGHNKHPLIWMGLDWMSPINIEDVYKLQKSSYDELSTDQLKAILLQTKAFTDRFHVAESQLIVEWAAAKTYQDEINASFINYEGVRIRLNGTALPTDTTVKRFFAVCARLLHARKIGFAGAQAHLFNYPKLSQITDVLTLINIGMEFNHALFDPTTLLYAAMSLDYALYLRRTRGSINSVVFTLQGFLRHAQDRWFATTFGVVKYRGNADFSDSEYRNAWVMMTETNYTPLEISDPKMQISMRDIYSALLF